MRSLNFTLILTLLFCLQPLAAQDLTITPAQLDFGSTKIDSFATLEFTLENIGEENFPTVTLISDDDAHFELNWTGERGEAMKAIASIRQIYQACWSYQHDFGEDPNSVDALIEQDYLELPDEVLAEWSFMLIGRNPITEIEAISRRNMPYGQGHVISFDVMFGVYSGYNTPLADTYEPVQVQETIGAIYNAIRMYRQDYREDPSSLDELLDLEYLDIYNYLLRNWQFEIVGEDRITHIEAVSKYEMIDGAGHVMLFDLEEGLFSGYRIDWVEYYDWLWGGPYGHPSLTMSVTYRPDAEMQHDSQITIIFSPREGEETVFQLPVTGQGVLSAPEDASGLPRDFAIHSTYPNPFNSSVTVEYSVEPFHWTDLSVYTLTGDRVATIYAGMPITRDHRVVWNATNVPSGSYFIMLDSGSRKTQQCVTLVK